MDMHDFVSGGGLYTTDLGYTANITSILIKSGNTYPLLGTVSLSPGYTANVSWTANGIVIFASANNAGLNLAPVILITASTTGNTSTLSGYSTVAEWQSNNYISY